MRVIFSVLSLLVVVAIVGVLAKKNLGASAAAPARPGAQAVATPTGTPQQQVQQVRQAVEAQMQQARPMPDDTK